MSASRSPLLKRIGKHPRVQHSLGSLLAGYLKLVGRSTHFTIEPADALDDVQTLAPMICAMWHGQHFMIPLALRPGMRFATLISRHGDGEINAIAAEKLGIAAIRGSGAQNPEEVRRRGGAAALRQMLTVLESGTSLCLTADVPKIARVAGQGIVTLAKYSGRPIVPVAVVTRRRIAFKSWDRASIGTPWNHGAIVLGEAIRVARDADASAIETARLAVQDGLDFVHRRAYALAGGVDPGADIADVLAQRQKAKAGAE